MRELKFIVSGQTIQKDPACDFTGIARGTKGYLSARFEFDSEWNGCRKAAVFKKYNHDYPVPLINGTCKIPEESAAWDSFFVSVVGEKDGYRITTNRVEVEQNG